MKNAKTKTRKKSLVSTVAIALAVVMLISGGTIAYLSAASPAIVNNFNANSITIDLGETTGTEYEIIPGTSQSKDPVITTTATVDSYLYALVYGNNPETSTGSGVNYISYEIEDGWTVLPYDTATGYSDEVLAKFNVDWTGLTTTEITIYYREVDADDDPQEFHILKGDVVSYSSEITSIPDGIYLAFAGYTIQQQPFSSAYNAITQKVVSTASALTTALSNGEAATLSADISVTSTELNTAIAAAAASNAAAVIDLNGKTLTISDTDSTVLNNAELYLVNGIVNLTDVDASSSAIAVEEGAVLTLDNVTVNTTGSINVESGTENAEIYITNSTINSTGYYCVTTNAANTASGCNVAITIENSTLTATDGVDAYSDSAAILFNIPGTLTITDSILTGQRQGVIVRCGTANITDSKITTTAEYSGSAYYLDSNWGSGNEVPMAALVVGNRSSSAYPHSASAALSGVTLTVGDSSVPAIYAASSSYDTTVTGAASTDTVLYYVGSGSVTIGGTSVTGSITTPTAISTLS